MGVFFNYVKVDYYKKSTNCICSCKCQEGSEDSDKVKTWI